MKKLILLFLFLPVFATAQIVNIPDANFKAFLIVSSINTNLDSEIQVTEATATIGQLNVSFQSISDLTGLEAFTGITRLNCNNNLLTSLDVSNNTALTELGCHNNFLTSLDVSNNTALTGLYCTYNSLTSLDISNNTALTELYCFYNSLTSLDVSNNTALTWLNCGNNLLTSLDVSNNTSLTELYCHINFLTSLDVSNNTELTNLGCYDNFLTSLDVSNNTALTGLYCTYNFLTSLNVSNNTALTYLNCNVNSLTSLDVSNNIALTDLFCQNNSLTNLDVRNGNNDNISFSFDATNNPNLNCISVDDSIWSTNNWVSSIDAGVVFSNDCSAIIGINENELDQISISGYGNTITIKGKGTVTIFNTVGKRVHSSKLHSGNNTISLKKGIYLVRIKSNDKYLTRKVFLSGLY